MKLTIEDNPEAIKRYRHIRPAPRAGTIPCSVGCPGTTRTCTQKRGHGGPHIAHGRFKRVEAVWDRGAQISSPRLPMKKVTKTLKERERGGSGFLAGLRSAWKAIVPKEHFIEEALLILFALGMVWFAIDWALRIIGIW